MKFNKLFTNVGSFFKRNAYYVVLFVCIAGIAAMITIAALNSSPVPVPPDAGNETPIDPDPDVDVDVPPITFTAPVADYELGKIYTGDGFVWYATLKTYRTHTGVDFKGAEGADVYAAYDGIVQSVSTNINEGTVVVIKHNDDLTTVYKSLANNAKVKQGDTVKKGDVIGKISSTMIGDLDIGNHVHFEVLYQGKFIDPMTYLETGGK